MSSSPGPARPGSAAGAHPSAEVLGAVRWSARSGADALLQHVPDTGDHATGRAVDAFVEQASDALRALAEAVGETLAAAGSGAAADGSPYGPHGAAELVGGLAGAQDAELPPRGWHW